MVWKDDRNDSLLLRQSIHVPAQAWVVHKEGHDGLLSSSVRDDRVGASKGLIPEEVENARVLREGMYICLYVFVIKPRLEWKRGCPRLVDETLTERKAWLPPSCWWNLGCNESVAARVLLMKPWIWMYMCPFASVISSSAWTPRRCVPLSECRKDSQILRWDMGDPWDCPAQGIP